MFCGPQCIPMGAAAQSVHIDEHEIERQVEQQRLEAELQRLEDERRLEEEAERARLYERRRKEERARLAEEARLHEQARLEVEEKTRQEWEEHARQQEAERLWQAQERARQQEAERTEVLDRFCARNGFSGIHDPRRAGCSLWGATTTYPLHCAAEQADGRIVGMLLEEGVPLGLKNSSNMTALQVAQKKNRGGSHDGVVRLLSRADKASSGGA